MSNSAVWQNALADFESLLDAATLALDVEDPDALDRVPAFAEPAVDGPLPAELVPAAEALLARNAEIVARIEVERGRIRDQLARIPRRPATESDARARFETHA